MRPERLPQSAEEASYTGSFCVGCCAPSERWWFRWVLPAQPLIALLVYLYAYA